MPTIVVFTQRDKKVDSLLASLMPDDYFTELDVKRLRPVAEAKAREHYLKLKDTIVARGLSEARFAVLGGLALLMAVLTCSAAEYFYCRAQQERGRIFTTVQRLSPTDRKRVAGNVQAVASIGSR